MVGVEWVAVGDGWAGVCGIPVSRFGIGSESGFRGMWLLRG